MRRRFRTHLWLLLAAATLLACGGDDPVTGPEEPDPDPDPQTATLHGRLVNSATREPVGGASIHFGDATTTSDHEGRFRLTDLSPGTGTLRASAAGFEDLEQDVTLPSSFVLSFYLDRLEIVEFDDFGLYVNNRVRTVRGVVLALGGPDTRAFATAAPFGAPLPEVEAALQTLRTRLHMVADSAGLAVLGTSLSGLPNEAATDELLAGALAEAAARSGRPEIATAPLLLYGMGAGGPPASGYAARNPGRTIGLYLKVPANVELLSGSDALAVPTFVALAEEDAFVDNAAIAARFADNRAAGGKWALATERAVPHHSMTARHREFTVHWMTDILDQRLVGTPGRVVGIPETTGWLGDPATLDVMWWDNFTGDLGGFHWLPGWETGERWADLARASGPDASSMRLSPPAATLRVGWPGWVSATIRDPSGTLIWDPAVIFTSDREDVVQVSGESCNWYCDATTLYFVAAAEGVATITATYGGQVGQATVTVLPAVRLVVEPAEVTIPLGGAVDLTVRVFEESSGAVVTNPEFAIDWYPCCWESPVSYRVDPPVVDPDGTHFRVTGTAPGEEGIFFYPRGVSAPMTHAMIRVE